MIQNLDSMITAINTQAALCRQPFAIVTICGTHYAINANISDEPEAFPITAEEIAAIYADERESALACAVDLLNNDAQDGDSEITKTPGGFSLWKEGETVVMSEGEFVNYARSRDAIDANELLFAA